MSQLFHKIKRFIHLKTSRLFKPLLEDMTDELTIRAERLITISQLHHKTFAQYKNCFMGKSVVLIGAGPSLNQFKPIPDCIYVGLNRACLYGKVKFDFLFTIDKIGIDKIYDKFGNYDCVKFVGDQNFGPSFQIPESEIAKWGKVKRYKTDAGLLAPSHFALDIDSEPLGNFNTVSLQAMQFILFGNPKAVYLVGIDCTANGHFESTQTTPEESFRRLKDRGENLDAITNYQVLYWKEMKDFASTYYPDTEIISVNPVGLRGVFKDFDQ